MAQHKAPTAVTIAPVSEKSGLALFVERYWKLGALLALVATAGILWMQYQKVSVQQTHARGWESLLAVAPPDQMGGLTGPPASILEVADRVKDTSAGPWSLFVAARASLDKREFDVAISALDRLRTNYPQHALVTEPLPVGKEGTSASAVDLLRERIKLQRGWETSRPALFKNPEPPADAPRVRLNTDKGAIVVQLYPDQAPKHVENFVKLAREGYFVGHRFHSVRQGSWVRSGDPLSKEADVAKWGTGGPGYGVDAETNDLRHFAGYLSMFKQPGEAQSSGSQFTLTTGATHSLDGQETVFGKVVEGLDVLTAIESARLVEGTDRPEENTTIQAVEVL